MLNLVLSEASMFACFFRFKVLDVLEYFQFSEVPESSELLCSFGSANFVCF